MYSFIDLKTCSVCNTKSVLLPNIISLIFSCSTSNFPHIKMLKKFHKYFKTLNIKLPITNDKVKILYFCFRAKYLMDHYLGRFQRSQKCFAHVAIYLENEPLDTIPAKK